MVLQRYPHQAMLWGYGNISSTVTLKLDGDSYVVPVTAGKQFLVNFFRNLSYYPEDISFYSFGSDSSLVFCKKIFPQLC